MALMNRGQDFSARMGLLCLGLRQGLPGRSIHCFDPTGVEIRLPRRMRAWSTVSFRRW